MEEDGESNRKEKSCLQNTVRFLKICEATLASILLIDVLIIITGSELEDGLKKYSADPLIILASFAIISSLLFLIASFHYKDREMLAIFEIPITAGTGLLYLIVFLSLSWNLKDFEGAKVIYAAAAIHVIDAVLIFAGLPNAGRYIQVMLSKRRYLQ